MRRHLFWAMVAVALVTLFIGGVTASILITRSVEDERRQEFFRQAEATGQLIQAQLQTEAGTSQRQLAQLRTVLRAAIAIGGHDFVEVSVVAPRFQTTLPADAKLIPALGRKIWRSSTNRGPSELTSMVSPCLPWRSRWRSTARGKPSS